MSDEIYTLLSRVRARIQVYGLKQSDLARDLRVSQKHVSQVLHHKSACSTKLLQQMLDWTEERMVAHDEADR